ncbi:MAG: hypothetical protein MUO57_18770 [Anaerolineales bacterium]|nr:hypothetical protein [Anaerolineales bacterium]
MIDTIKLYLSAANDLSAERDLVSRVVAEIPVTLGWKINLSPIGNKAFDERLILETDLHLILLGEDIRAPIGFEWYLSRQVGRKPVFLIKDHILRTLAAGDFLRTISNYPKILFYHSLADFRKQVLNHIGQHLLEQAEFFTIKSEEFENLSKFLEDLEEIETEILDNVTGEDSIILTRERFTPKGGVLIQLLEDEQNPE